MTRHYRVAVIGGGIAGCSVLYHLAQLGWTDTLLLEKTELTAGSTWHAAGHLATAAGSLSLSRMHLYSIRLYQQLEKELGYPLGLHITGSLALADTTERLDEFKRAVERSRTIGLDYQLIGPDDAKALFPFLNVAGLRAAIYDALHSHIDPSSATNALAGKAVEAGATIKRRSKVTALTQTSSGWSITVNDSEVISAEHVVIAAGMWADAVGKLAGYALPNVPMQHQYLVTGTIKELAELQGDLPIIRDRDRSFYLRKERDGFLIGIYEKDGKPWAIDGIPDSFGQELLDPDLERIEEELLRAADRIPLLGEAGIKTIVNGPISYAPDGRPVIGPVPHKPGLWACTGFTVGIAQGGGAGKMLAEWLVEGYPEIDPMPFQPARFGDFTTRSYTINRAIEAYIDHHHVSYPDRETDVARPAKTTAIYDLLAEEGAVFGTVFGWERPIWFAPKGLNVMPDTFRRGVWHEHVGQECAAVREAAALSDLTSMSKFIISGEGAETFFETMFSRPAPKRVDRVGFTLLLNARGGIMGDFVAVRLGEERFYIVGPSSNELNYHSMLQSAARPGVVVENVTATQAILHIAGPRARMIVQSLLAPGIDLVDRLGVATLDLDGCPALVLGISFTGAEGFELHLPAQYHRALYLKLRKAGEPHGLRLMGMRALNALRLEAGFRTFGSDLSPDVLPEEAGLSSWVSRSKLNALPARPEGQHKKLVTLAVETSDRDALGGEPVFAGGAMVGTVTSGAYGFSVGKSLATAYLDAALAVPGQAVEVSILGDLFGSVVLADPAFDTARSDLRQI
ncbi:MAG: dehydrogenase [Stutzerimonas stutzeri]|jgi:dimethylglycine dehydrogenase|nr:MAG: dehydrogenase [Stutzerimonas stutzeri]